MKHLKKRPLVVNMKFIKIRLLSSHNCFYDVILQN